MKKNDLIRIIIIFIASVYLCSINDVYAGGGCCSHHIGVDESRCTIDGRQVCEDDFISSCSCDPDDYDEDHLVDPDGHDETNPNSYWHGNNYKESNNNYNQYNDLDIENDETEKRKHNEEIVDENIKEDYLALSCTALIGTLIVYLNGIPPKKERDI